MLFRSDGKGARRVAQILRAPALLLRPAAPADTRLVFDWANDPQVRAVSFTAGAIAWPDHERWFQAQLASPGAVLLIAETPDHQPVGIARFVIADGVATISISVAAGFRGSGYGRQLIEKSSRQILQRADVRAVHAFVKADNPASARAFLAAGYREASAPGPHGARVFVFHRPQS